MEDPVESYSIIVTVKRTTVEYAFVSVPVDEAIMQRNDKGDVSLDEKGHAHIDGAKLFERGVEIARHHSSGWYPESQAIEPHPVQQPPTEAQRLAALRP